MMNAPKCFAFRPIPLQTRETHKPICSIFGTFELRFRQYQISLFSDSFHQQIRVDKHVVLQPSRKEALLMGQRIFDQLQRDIHC